jgi:pimeloyl-ACP methyl ester carboxylesterase
MKLTLAFFLTLLTTSLHASICVEQTNDEGEVSWLHCPRNERTLFAGTIYTRDVLWQLPTGTPPRQGWPVVLLSQGSWFPIEFSRPRELPFGGFNEVRLIQNLLDNGFAVIAPRATLQIGWITNIPHRDYVRTADYKVLSEVLRLIRAGGFGKLNAAKMYATGISSGGYNTSRVAITFPRTFRAIAIQSGSYATCLGPLCRMPKSLPQDHPPTLMLHGERDLTVPLVTAKKFLTLLEREGIPNELITDPKAGHAWIDAAPSAVVNWFKRY